MEFSIAWYCRGRFVDDGDTTGVVARRVSSPTAAAQHHSQATYLADGALRVNLAFFSDCKMDDVS